MDQNFSLGARLRALRTERKLSQRDLAKAAGVSPNSISLIERDEISPSVATLQSLASALQVRVSYFFEAESNSEVIHIKAGRLPTLSTERVRIAGVGQHLRGQEVEPFLVSLEPGAGSGERQVVHPGHEIVFCLKGNLEYLIDGKIYGLETGDFLLFEASLPHLWRNPHESSAEFLLLIQTPDESPEPVKRHFADYASITHLSNP